MHSDPVTVTVRYTNGTHQTNTVRGLRDGLKGVPLLMGSCA